jgi:hypothetical protein
MKRLSDFVHFYDTIHLELFPLLVSTIAPIADRLLVVPLSVISTMILVGIVFKQAISRLRTVAVLSDVH